MYDNLGTVRAFIKAANAMLDCERRAHTRQQNVFRTKTLKLHPEDSAHCFKIGILKARLVGSRRETSGRRGMLQACSGKYLFLVTACCTVIQDSFWDGLARSFAQCT
eukprot:3200642-Pleurochrysis_carterae.AAC.1